jgi:Protein of unknown function (DUF2628)
MSVYTVHQSPKWTADPLPDAERIEFVRDGFSFWAFLFPPLWMVWHRMWLVLPLYVVVGAALEAPLLALGATAVAASVVGLFTSLLVGLEASTLRRFTLRQRGWRNVGIVSGDDLEDAERRFFSVWLDAASSQRAVPPASAPAGATTAGPRMPRAPDVIGLFPEPGGHP